MSGFNPGAYNFVPGGSFIPRAPEEQQGQGQGAQDPNAPPGAYNPYNPYAQQPGAGAGAYGAYGGGAYGNGYAQRGYDQAQGAYGQQGYAGGYGGYQQQQQQGAYAPPHARQAPAPAPAAAAPFTPPTASGPSKTVSLNIGGGGAKVVPPSTGPAKTVSLSIGGAKPAAPTPAATGPAKVLSLGKGGKTTLGENTGASTPASASGASSAAASRSATPAPESKSSPAKKEAAKKTDKEDGMDWEADEVAKPAAPAAAATPAPAAEPAAAAPASAANKTNYTRQMAKNDADAIAREAAKMADNETLQELYGGEEVDPSIKHHLNLVFIGHVDAGKSTMGGQLLVLCGMVDKRTLEKLEREAKEAGRESWYLSWALDSTPEERAKGKTVQVGRAAFETDKRRYTILDAPGHKTYVPSMISGAAQADVAVLVISARKGEFETGFERGGQTREHAMLVKNNGVSKLIVVVNKMDDPTVAWAKERFDEVCSKITPYLKSVGFNPKTDITFIPVSAQTGQNMKERVDKKLADWSDGPALLEFLDDMPVTDRKVNAPFMLPVAEKYNEMGSIVVGKIESGRVKKGDSLLLMPNKVPVDVAGIYDEQGEELPGALCGDNVRIRLRGVSDEDVSPGFVLTSAARPIKVVTQFRCDLAVLDAKNIISAGYSCVMHLHTLTEEVVLTQLLHYYDKMTKRRSRKAPQFAKKGMRVVAMLETAQPISVEKFDDYPMLGRFTLRDEGKTIAIGKVTKVDLSDAIAPAMSNLNVDGDATAAA